MILKKSQLFFLPVFLTCLLNGASGIAVGMATNIAPHNLTEIVDATVAYIDNPEILKLARIDGSMYKAPDFPTGGTIYGYDGVKEAFETGRGRIVVRAQTYLEELWQGTGNRLLLTKYPIWLIRRN